jgi:primosomal protein N' (replication factor Y)
MNYAQIVVFHKITGFDDVLTYLVPEDLEPCCAPGQAVLVPFRNKTGIGIIYKITDDLPPDADKSKIRPISKVLPHLKFEKPVLHVARMIAEYYQTKLSRSLRLFLPSIIEKRPDLPVAAYYSLTKNDVTVRGVKQKAVVQALQNRDSGMPEADLKNSIEGLTGATLNSLIKAGIIEKKSEPLFHPPGREDFSDISFNFSLTEKQTEVLGRIENTDKPVLLHGVTGSGKTEIYLRLIAKTIQRGRQAIMLVPEIALTPQMVDYFKKYFGGHMALFHSRLTDAQRANEWWKVKCGQARLVIGSRSAIFAPVSDLGVLIIDEEHEWTYKQESTPYYTTHRIAEELCKLHKSRLVLGSATPRAESFLKSRKGEYEYLELPDRISENSMPKIHIIDLREEFHKKNFSIFSLALQNKIRQRLEAKEQIILFVNQRGLSRAVVCRDCGHTEKCPQCEISLKVHRTPSGLERYKCHYCDFYKDPVIVCPQCKSPYIKQIGVGTQRVEDEVHKLFPQAKTLRADQDTTTSSGFEPIYRHFLEGDADVLIGTQMVAKGLDFHRVTLVGIILADIGLSVPDFRSHERVFQLIIQVAGRCGRGKNPGEVVLQTYQPDHFAIQKAAVYDYTGFMENELKYRKNLGYPPYGKLIKFTVVGADEGKLSDHIQVEKETLEDIFKVNNLDVKIVSAPAMVPKISNLYHRHILLRSDKPEIVFKHWKTPKGWRIDVDPIHTS